MSARHGREIVPPVPYLDRSFEALWDRVIGELGLKDERDVKDG